MLGWLLPPPEISIQYRDGEFLLQGAYRCSIISIAPTTGVHPPTRFEWKVQGRPVTWNERGLIYRVGKQTVTTRLPDISLTRKLFTREEILETRAKIKSGLRNRGASSVMGWAYSEPDLILLLRWTEAKGTPWLEALVRVGIDHHEPNVKLLGRFEGLSTALVNTSNRLVAKGDELSAFAVKDLKWGYTRINLPTNERSFTPLGTWPARLLHESNATSALFAEPTEFGTWLAGTIDLETMGRHNLFEGRRPIEFLATSPPCFVTHSGKYRIVHSGKSGAEIRIPEDSGAKMTGDGILIWSPAKHPINASLLDPIKVSILSKWKSSIATSSSALPSERFHKPRTPLGKPANRLRR